MTDKDLSDKDLSDKDLSQKDLSQEDLSQKDLSQENKELSNKELSQEDLSEEEEDGIKVILSYEKEEHIKVFKDSKTHEYQRYKETMDYLWKQVLFQDKKVRRIVFEKLKKIIPPNDVMSFVKQILLCFNRMYSKFRSKVKIIKTGLTKDLISKVLLPQKYHDSNMSTMITLSIFNNIVSRKTSATMKRKDFVREKDKIAKKIKSDMRAGKESNFFLLKEKGMDKRLSIIKSVINERVKSKEKTLVNIVVEYQPEEKIKKKKKINSLK